MSCQKIIRAHLESKKIFMPIIIVYLFYLGHYELVLNGTVVTEDINFNPNIWLILSVTKK